MVRLLIFTAFIISNNNKSSLFFCKKIDEYLALYKLGLYLQQQNKQDSTRIRLQYTIHFWTVKYKATKVKQG